MSILWHLTRINIPECVSNYLSHLKLSICSIHIMIPNVGIKRIVCNLSGIDPDQMPHFLEDILVNIDFQTAI